MLDEITQRLPQLLAGTWITVQLTVYSAVIGLLIAVAVGLMGLSGRAWVRGVARAYVEVFRGLAVLILMFWFFYSLPLLGLRLAPMFAGVLALGLNAGAYGAEVVRGAVLAVPRPQYEAAVALNFSAAQRMRLVILPQAWVGMIPPFNNLLIQLLKCTPLLSLVTIADLTFEGQQLRGATGESEMAYLFLLVVYFVLAYLFTLVMNALESVAKAKLGRGQGLRAVFRLRPADAHGESAGVGLSVGG